MLNRIELRCSECSFVLVDSTAASSSDGIEFWWCRDCNIGVCKWVRDFPIGAPVEKFYFYASSFMRAIVFPFPFLCFFIERDCFIIGIIYWTENKVRKPERAQFVANYAVEWCDLYTIWRLWLILGLLLLVFRSGGVGWQILERWIGASLRAIYHAPYRKYPRWRNWEILSLQIQRKNSAYSKLLHSSDVELLFYGACHDVATAPVNNIEDQES